MSATTLFKNCYLVTPGFEGDEMSVLVKDGKIARIYAPGDALPDCSSTVDCTGKLLLPGFVDVHCHGRSGYDFCDAKVEGIARIAKDKLAEGVTTLLPTTLTLSEEQLSAALQSAADYVASGNDGCKLPGVHLEGPYINSKLIGAQNPAYVRLPDIEEVKRLNAIYPVKKVSFAPEVEGGAEFSAELLAMGITPSAVHTNAKYAEFQDAFNHGLRNLSHFCNQMTALHHRDIGMVGAGLMNREVFIEFICDKLHICPDMIELVFSLKNVEYIQLISDAMRASGMPDGEYDLGGMQTFVKNGAARLENGALAGSTLQICDALKNVYEITDLELSELVKTTSWNQARALNLPGIGKIEPGFCADLVLLDDEFKVLQTYVDGELRYQA
jgi:N-acetylglucosamine-6-phosphate deacetylase